MAADSSDESVAPKDFHLSSSLDSGSVLTFNHHICQLCNNFRKTFYCKQCIRNGDFTHSSSSISERFAEKQLRLVRLKNSKQIMQEKCSQLLERKKRHDQLVSDTRQCKMRITNLQRLIQEIKDSHAEKIKQLDEQNEINKTLSVRVPRYGDRVMKLERYVEDRSDGIQGKHRSLHEQLNELKGLTKITIQQLVEYIFPITKVLPTPHSSDANVLSLRSAEDGVSAILAEAQRTAYVRGRWVQLSDNETSAGGLRYRIVAPTLPESGDYSAYNDWVASHRDSGGSMLSGSGVGAVAELEHNAAFTISAALTYTAQLINVLAYYLDVRLPHKLSYSDFCTSGDMPEGQFARRVARLNGNVLHLCFAQNVNPQILRPASTIHNLLCLLNPDTSDIGRRGPVEIDPKEAFMLEEQLTHDLGASEDDSGSEEDILPWEWEAVPHVQCPEVEMLAMGSQHSAMAGGSQTPTGATSIAGGLVTSAAASIASLWRGWTK